LRTTSSTSFSGPSGRGAISVVLDCSFLSHATIPSQSTDEALGALIQLVASGTPIIVTDVLVLEFGSLLRKLTNKGMLEAGFAEREFHKLVSMSATTMGVGTLWGERAFELARRLNQSDIFDCAGYVIAQSVGAEFITSDRRFANAARAANLPGVRFIA